MALGIIMNNPVLLYNGKYKIERKDFDGNMFHKMLFACIENIAMTGVKEIDAPSVSTFVNSSDAYRTVRAVLEEENYMDFIVSYKEVAKNSGETFDFYYNNIKKNTLLREYKSLGYNIDAIYDEAKDEDSQKKQLNDYSIADIINHFEKIQIKLKNEFQNDVPIEQSYAGENVENLLEMLSITPLTGASLNSPYITTLSNGWSQGHLILKGGDSGCVDCDTEYFNGHGWKRIADYTRGEKVLQYNEDGTASLVKPLRCIKGECEKMIHLKSKLDVDQMLSAEHRVITYTGSGEKRECSAKDFAEYYTIKEGLNLDRNFKTTFRYASGKGIDLTNDEIRLMVAAFIDGNFEDEDGRCCFHLKENEKKVRLRMLLSQCGNTIRYQIRNSKEKDYEDILAYTPIIAEHFPDSWYQATPTQMYVICDEVMKWNGYYQSNCKEDIDFVQFAFVSCGLKAVIGTVKRKGYEDSDYWLAISRKTITATMSRQEGEKFNPIQIKKTGDGFKYCFTVPSHMLVLRRNGKIFITGNSGKSLQAIADTALVCCPQLYDPMAGDFVDNPNYQEGGGLYIHTEQSQFFEIQPRFLSYVSNVECWKILNNVMNDKEKERVVEAGHILAKGKIHLMSIPHFTLNTIYDNVKNVSLNEGIHTFVFDYIFNNGIAISEYSRLVGIKSIREDQFFLMMATRLKEIAEEFNLRVMTMSQLNGKQKDPKMRIVDERCLFGSTSLKTKLDSGYICTAPRKAELDEIMPLIRGNRFGDVEINNITHCFKTRHSQYKSNLKIWQSLNKSTGRIVDVLVTDSDNEPIRIDKTMFEGLHLIKE